MVVVIQRAGSVMASYGKRPGKSGAPRSSLPYYFFLVTLASTAPSSEWGTSWMNTNILFILYLVFTGGHNNQDPGCTQKPIYTPLFYTPYQVLITMYTRDIVGVEHVTSTRTPRRSRTGGRGARRVARRATITAPFSIARPPSRGS